LLFDSAKPETAETSGSESPDVLENIEELSDEEVERRLATDRDGAL
jgi:hypothetical protein